jgi:hypothetical protein
MNDWENFTKKFSKQTGSEEEISGWQKAWDKTKEIGKGVAGEVGNFVINNAEGIMTGA